MRLGHAGEGVNEEGNGPDALFRLAGLKGAKATAVGEATVPDEEEPGAESPSSADEDEGEGAGAEDSDDARR